MSKRSWRRQEAPTISPELRAPFRSSENRAQMRAATTRSIALLIGIIGFACMFDLDAPTLGRREDISALTRRLQSQISRGISARNLKTNQDMPTGVRGPYGHSIEPLDALLDGDKTTNRATVKRQQHHHQQHKNLNSAGFIQNIRKGLRNMLGGEDTIIDRNHRSLGEYNLAIVNNVTNETEVQCQFTATMGPDQIAEETDPSTFVNTIIVGYPGPDKRTVLRQMEAMTGLSGRDAWDFQFLGMTAQPYIKTNYPHHEGIWGWQDHADQVVLILRNPRRSIDEYHDILADIHYAKTWEEATERIPDLFQGIIEADKYAMWRNERFMDEIGWYGWLIDYWMEDGLLRDYFDHKVTTPEHFELLREPETYTYGELQWDVNVCEDAVSKCAYVSCNQQTSTHPYMYYMHVSSFHRFDLLFVHYSFVYSYRFQRSHFRSLMTNFAQRMFPRAVLPLLFYPRNASWTTNLKEAMPKIVRLD